MPAYARREIVDETEVGVYHCVSRCVRRAFLCGQDALTDHSYEHRKAWIQSRLRPILERLSINGDAWFDTITCFGCWFHRAVGRLPSTTAVLLNC